MDSNKARRGKHQVNLTLDGKRWAKLEEAGAASELSKSAIVRKALDQYLKRRKQIQLRTTLTGIDKARLEVVEEVDEEDGE